MCVINLRAPVGVEQMDLGDKNVGILTKFMKDRVRQDLLVGEVNVLHSSAPPNELEVCMSGTSCTR